jgi:hypothetical protein
MHKLGFWSAIGACFFSVAYGIPQILQVAGILHDPLDRILIFAPSLFLAPFFVVTLAAAFAKAPAVAKPWRLAALAIGILYGAMASQVYITQLGVVIPHELRGEALAVQASACCTFQQPMTVIDLLGYTYMAIALFLLVPTYQSKPLRFLLVANGLLAPFLILQLYWPQLIYVGALWLFLFPAALFLMARDFAGAKWETEVVSGG